MSHEFEFLDMIMEMRWKKQILTYQSAVCVSLNFQFVTSDRWPQRPLRATFDLRSSCIFSRFLYLIFDETCLDFSGAEIRSVCTEAGMFAIRARRKMATEKDFLEAVNKVIKAYAKFSSTPRYMTYNWSESEHSKSETILNFVEKEKLRIVWKYPSNRLR